MKENTISNKKILDFVKSEYVFTDFKNIYKKETESHNHIYNLTDVYNNKYIIKIYRTFDLNKIKKEQEINKYLKNKIPFVVSAYENINYNLYSVDNKRKIILTILPNIKGSVFKNVTKLTNKQIKESAFWLAKLHNLSCPKKFIEEFDLKEDILKGLKIYKSILKKINQKKYLNDFEKIIRNVLISRLDNIENCLFDTKTKSIIHGDFAPANIIFNNNTLSIIDWERSRCYMWQYDLFRALSNFSSKGIYTPYDSAKDFKKINLFLKYYSQKRKKVNNKEIEVLKKMPRFFCFIDTYPFESFFLKKQNWTKRFLPKNKKEYFWWVDNENKFINLIDKYFK